MMIERTKQYKSSFDKCDKDQAIRFFESSLSQMSIQVFDLALSASDNNCDLQCYHASRPIMACHSESLVKLIKVLKFQKQITESLTQPMLAQISKTMRPCCGLYLKKKDDFTTYQIALSPQFLVPFVILISQSRIVIHFITFLSIGQLRSTVILCPEMVTKKYGITVSTRQTATSVTRLILIAMQRTVEADQIKHRNQCAIVSSGKAVQSNARSIEYDSKFAIN